MGIGVSIFLIAVGAILAFAVDASAEGVNLDTIGVILMVVGGVGLLAALVFFNDAAPWHRRDVVDDAPADDVVVRRRRR